MNEQSPSHKTISGKSARKSAALFNWGNMIAMSPGLIVIPMATFANPDRMAMIFMFILMIVPMILWFAASIVIYIIARHHPNERVGHYTQQAAYRYYGLVGIIVVAGTFFGTDVRLWLITWTIAALIIIPWSILDLVRIRKEQWQDITLQEENE